MRVHPSLRLPLALVAGLLGLAGPAFADFESDLERVDEALRTNPRRVSEQVLDSCLKRRNFAAKLYAQGRSERAARSLAYCFRLLGLPATPKAAAAPARAPDLAAVRARAAREIERALVLEPDPVRGLALYRECALCHMPEGWGTRNGLVPQIAGQHRTVVIKQLADIRAGHREAPVMEPYASVDVVGGPQGVADVAAYVATLEISVDNGKGPGEALALGARLYAEQCGQCHGPEGEGDAEAHVPRLQAQHFPYLVRQFEAIRDGRRRNADSDMTAHIREMGEREMRAVLDHVSRLEPPPELQAPAGWQNPDFPDRSPYDAPQLGDAP